MSSKNISQYTLTIIYVIVLIVTHTHAHVYIYIHASKHRVNASVKSPGRFTNGSSAAPSSKPPAAMSGATHTISLYVLDNSIAAPNSNPAEPEIPAGLLNRDERSIAADTMAIAMHEEYVCRRWRRWRRRMTRRQPGSLSRF